MARRPHDCKLPKQRPELPRQIFGNNHCIDTLKIFTDDGTCNAPRSILTCAAALSLTSRRQSRTRIDSFLARCDLVPSPSPVSSPEIPLRNLPATGVDPDKPHTREGRKQQRVRFREDSLPVLGARRRPLSIGFASLRMATRVTFFGNLSAFPGAGACPYLSGGAAVFGPFAARIATASDCGSHRRSKRLLFARTLFSLLVP